MPTDVTRMPAPGGARLIGEQLRKDTAVHGVEVAHGFVEQHEVEGLAQGPHEGHALLLSEGEASHGCRTLVGHAGRGKQLLDTRFALEMCQIVLQGDILLDRELLEESQVLKQHAQRAAPHVVPLRARGLRMLRPSKSTSPA